MGSVKNKNPVKGFWKAVLLGVFLFVPAFTRAEVSKETDTPTSSATTGDSAPEADVTAVEPVPTKDLTQLSLESLAGLNVQVVSSSKKTESLRDATSAIFVITQDDIQQSGARHLADLFKMVPGMLVSRVDASEWTVTARGFNSLYNANMLVLIDGRSVYQSTFGGVNWDELDIPLGDIDRIEVIRGPGGTLWGSNAVNGVVNIITKDSKATQGLYATSQTGSDNNDMADLRWGGKIDDDFYYRVYAKTQNQGPFFDPDGPSGNGLDHWTSQQTGFRMDLHSEKDLLTFQGDYQVINAYGPGIDLDAATLQSTPDDNDTVDRDSHLLAHWVHTFSGNSEMELKSYYDLVGMSVPDGQDTSIQAFDLEFQHRFLLDNWNEVTWGGEFRNVADDYNQPYYRYYDPEQASLNTYGGFLQDKLTLSENQLYLTAGTKLENNPYTGNEWEPTARMLFTPDSNNSFWAAVSRTVGVPSRAYEDVTYFEQGFVAPGPTTLYAALVGNPNLGVEDVVTYELGYRTNLAAKVSLDLAGFYDRYDQVITSDFTTYSYPNLPPTPIGGYYAAETKAFNADGGAIYGAELSVKWDITDKLKSAWAYTYNGYDSVFNSISNIFNGNPPPHNIVDGRLSWDLCPALQFNTSLYWVDATFINDPTGQFTGVVAAYDVWDLGATWKVSSQWEVSVWGQDLEGTHTEASSFLGGSQPLPSVYGQLTARY